MAEPVTTLLPIAIILLPIAIAIPIYLTRKNPNLRETISIAAAAISIAAVLSMLQPILNGTTYTWKASPITNNLHLINLHVDPLGIFFATIISILWLLALLYSIGYMRPLKEHAQTRYYAFYALSISAAFGMAFSGSLLTFFLFYEVLTVATYPLVFHEENKKAFDGAFKYMMYLLLGSKLLLFSIVGTYLVTGTLDFVPGGIMHNTMATKIVLTAIFFGYVFGLIKVGLMPLHSWLPNAMVAPTPVSALLHAVAVVKAGAFGIVRLIYYVYGPDTLHALNLNIPLAILASITIVMASVYALKQDNLKRRLAYSTVSQLSYIVLGMALLTQAGMRGGIFHIVNHAFSKITLFFVAGAIIVVTGKKKISDMHGIGRIMPWTMGAFFIGTLSMIGLPPASGFWSKWYLLIGSGTPELAPFTIVLITSSILNAGYFLPVVYVAFFKKPDPSLKKIRKDTWFLIFPLLATATGVIILFLYPDTFMHLIDLILTTPPEAIT